MTARSAGLTPMMSQYRRVKDRHQDAILLFRLGDFYEAFFDDAATVSRELEITLTSREAGKGQRVPMAGIPHHAAEGHIARLLERGYRVALCDQVEDPRLAKDLVRREVTRVITPGTTVSSRALADKDPNYLAVATLTASGDAGLAVSDFSTGEFRATEFRGPAADKELLDELLRVQPREILLDPVLHEREGLRRAIGQGGLAAPRPAEEWEADPERAGRALCEHLGTVSLEAFGLAGRPAATVAAHGLLAFLRGTQRELRHVSSLRWYSREDFMCLDQATRLNLELVAALRDGRREHSLLWAIDGTMTAMGARLLRQWVTQPLVRLEPIVERQAAVAVLVARPFDRAEIRRLLRGGHDLERLSARAGTGLASARDLAAVRSTLHDLPKLKELLRELDCPRLRELDAALDPLPDLAQMLDAAIAEDPPAGLQEGGLIKTGYHPEVDRLRELRSGGKSFIAGLEARERERTGIRSLRIGFNRVFGYYIEVTRSNLAAVPTDYTRRQTLVNGERYVTPELKEREEEILGAEERLFGLEYEVFGEVRSRVAAQSARIQRTARAVAELDCLAGLAETAVAQRYVRPEVTAGFRVAIGGGRHPVLERTLESGFVPNDALLDEERRVLVITGPNMAGKSTYLRQTALIVLLAQIGSFVPAERAEIGIVDGIYTRIGARDDLSAGRSTFMVEMQEVAYILRHATRSSLVVLDEVGRGTSTFDGISLAHAVVEFLIGVGSRTLFATHYHELVGMESDWPGVVNLSTSVIDRDGEIVFPHKLRPGGADRSYGIEVARLAGVPAEVLARARVLLGEIESLRPEVAAAAAGAAEHGPRSGAGLRGGSKAARPRQVSFLVPAPSPVLDELRAVDPLKLTPIEALNLLWALQRKARDEAGEPDL